LLLYLPTLDDRIGNFLQEACPAFTWDFKDLFFGVSVRVGSSDVLHTDWSDNRRGGVAFVIPLTTWEQGGDLKLPQLGISARPVAGDVTCFQAGRLLHEATTPSGERVVLTLFTCNGLFASAL
jgi:hypothetical protein